jgi:hypothetical protein
VTDFENLDNKEFGEKDLFLELDAFNLSDSMYVFIATP